MNSEITNWEEYYTENIVDGKLTIQNKNINVLIRFTNEIKDRIEFSNCYILGVNFENVDLVDAGAISFSNCKIHNHVNINGQKTNFRNSFQMWLTEASVAFSDGKFNQVILNLINESNIHISKGEFKELKIYKDNRGGQLKALKLDTEKVIGSINIGGIDEFPIDRLVITGRSKDLFLTLENLIVNELIIQKYKSEYGLRINKLRFQKPNSKFHILDSHIGKSEINSTDFNLVDEIKIHNSLLTDSTFLLVDMPFRINSSSNKKFNLQFKKNNNLISQNVINRDVFRQLKHIYSKSEDGINENLMHSFEMISLYRSLSWSLNNLDTKFIILFSWFTSDFGQNIFRPILLLFSFQMVFILGLLITNNFPNSHFTFYPNQTVTELNFYVFKQYFNLLSPINDFISQNKWGIIIESFMKVWNSYMIYNFIRASRRFIK